MNESRRRQRGSIALLVALTMIPMLAILGLVVDLGWYYYTTESARAAAESAALAGVQYAMDDVASGGSYTCNSNELTCQGQTNCASTAPNPITSNLQNGCSYASANGFTTGGLNGKQTVTIQAGTTSPPPMVSGVNDALYWVSVRVYQTNPLTFLGVLGGSTVGIGVRATAAVIPAPVTGCLVALDPSASAALDVTGSAIVTASNCTVAVNSTNSGALQVGGNGTLQASAIQVNGGYQGTSISPDPITGKTLTNPYAYLPVPTFSSTPCASPVNNVYSQGTYCGGISLTGTTSATFNSGTYILLGGGLTVHGGASMTGSGVMFYNTCSPSPCNNSNAGTITINGGGNLNLSAPTSGVYTGILFFQDPTAGASTSVNFLGNNSTCLTGALYFPSSNVTFSGDSSASGCATGLVADTITMTGNSNSYFTGGGSVSGSPAAPTALLIE